MAAVVANGPHLGQVKWVKPRAGLGRQAPNRLPGAPPQHKSLAERQEQKGRQRQVHAIGLLKTALLEQPPPTLLTSVRLAVVFGTAQTHSSSVHSYDTALPRVAPGTDPAEERRRMLGHRDSAPDAGTHLGEPAATDPTPRDDALVAKEQQGQEGPLWRTFDALEDQEAAASGYLWARTLAVMLDRMTPNGDWRHVTVAWHEAERVADLVGLHAQQYLDQATAALPDPKSWAKERRPATPAQPPDPSPADSQPRPPENGTAPAARPARLRGLPIAPKRMAPRLPR